MTEHFNKTPSVKIVGLGGTGCNIINILRKNNVGVSTYCVDTSNANFLKEYGDFNILIGNGIGSGKRREVNIDPIRIDLPLLKNKIEVTDITIVISSLPGGTGSVLAPLFIKEFQSTTQLIYAGVSDTQSAIDINNSIGCIKSIENVAKKNNIYLPSLIYTNDSVNRKFVDDILVKDITNLLILLTAPTTAIDMSDRLSFLNVSNVVDDTTYGIKQLQIFTNKDYTDKDSDTVETAILNNTYDDTVYYDSVLSVGITGDRMNKLTSGKFSTDFQLAGIGKYSKFRKDGFFVDGDFAYIGVILPDAHSIIKILEEAENKLVHLQTMSKKASSGRKTLLSEGDDDSDDIVLVK